MTRGQMRSLLRRQLEDTASVQWPDDNELNDLLNIGYAMVQKEIRKSFPNAHQFWDYINTDGTSNWYPLPPTFGVRRVSLKQTDGTYLKLGLKNYDDIVSLAGREFYYAKEGQWIGVFPTPVALTNGIQVVHVPIMDMSADGDIPRIKLPLHVAIVWWTKLIAKGETIDQDGQEQTRLKELLSDLPLWYDNTSDGPEVIGLQI